MSGRTLAVDASGRLTNRAFLDDPRVVKVLALLDRDGEQARVVGGAVRNAALGLTPGDIDIATTAVPETVMARAKTARLRTIPTGVAHGTVTVVAGGLPLEITTLREDVETDGRHATVRFGRDFVADAQRRDFTINALSVDRTGQVHDYAGGVADLAARRVRFIGDPVTRIQEDYLRVLRFFRFSAFYASGELDLAGFAAVKAEAGGLRRLSRERIRAELLKLLSAPHAAAVVTRMAEAALLPLVVGLSGQPSRFARYRALVAARPAIPDPLLGLATLALGGESDAAILREHLRLSNEERDRLVRLADCISTNMAPRPPDSRAIATLLFTYGRLTAADAVTWWHAESAASPDDAGWQAAARFATIATIPELPVSGADILARGVQRGPRVGQTLKLLQAAWIRAGFPESPSVLHDLLDRAIEEAQSSDR